jgi:hypothetical protein
MDQSTYSLDLVPCYFWVFTKLKRNALTEQRSSNIPDTLATQRNVTNFLQVIPKTDFQDCFWQWYYRLM